MSNTCEHLDRIPDAAKTYNVVLAYYVTCIAEGHERKATEAHCNICRSHKRIHACLECAYFGCVEQDDGGMSHMKEHAVTNKHICAVSINHGCLFCFLCNDYVYNESFENILDEYQLEANKVFGYHRILPWKPKKKEIDELKDKARRIADDSYIGLRGVVNIGSSCYVNSVIQAFIHNPILRDFFLSDKHRCSLPKEVTCLTCEMFVLFQQFYSGVSIPLDASERFYKVLMEFCSAAPGVEQGDCCQLYQEILEGMHASYQPHQIGNCDCVIHQMFYGTNETLKRCSDCSTESLLPLDHFATILLDLEGKDDSLVNILNRKYLKPHLFPDHPCSKCEKKDTTQLCYTITKLPPIICFQVNFFGGQEKKGASRSKDCRGLVKKNIALAFKDTIDMTPYLKPKCLSYDKDLPACLRIENRYRLFAVIIHEGKSIEGGHYKAYVRNRGNRWYICDDVSIYSRNLEEVLKCEPSLLFYSKVL